MLDARRGLCGLALCFGQVGLAGCGAETDVDSVVEESNENLAAVTLEREWLLAADGLTTGATEVRARFTLPKSFTSAWVSLDSVKGVGKAVTRGADGAFAIALDVTALGTGKHRLLVLSKDKKRTLGLATFQRSAALYVVVSTDWDDTRMSDAYLARMDGVRQHHPELRVTQFFAPYHYTDPQVTPARKLAIETWIKTQRDSYGDELGVHIHGWCHFVKTTGVPCRTKETFYKDDGSGYTTILAAYTELELTTLLEAAKALYATHGLGSPTSFRAGGWTADAKVLRALVATGFAVDSSAVPFSYLASWKGYGLWDWTSAHWQGITETTQPYFPSAADPAKAALPSSLPILEVPDNGVLVDYVTAEQMLAIYRMNHDGGALGKPTVYQVGWHPPNFSSEYMTRIDTALDEVDAHLYSKDRGPAVYVTIRELTKVFRP